MKLQKFIKNKKVKTTFLASIVALVFVVGGITLYRTFALYQEERTFNVLVGVVPNFNQNTDTYTEELLNGADPVLGNAQTSEIAVEPTTSDKLIPVKIEATKDGTGTTVTVADLTEEWYDYETKKWANAVILKDSSKNPEPGTELQEDEIESYFVWIPKYKYKLFNLEEYSTTTTKEDKSNQAIEIVFGLDNTENKTGECATPNKSGDIGQCKKDDYMTHPAFLAFDGNGLWVGKFETGEKDATSSGANEITKYDASYLNKLVVKPNQYSWTNINVSTMHQIAYNYQRGLESHMMKNTEWGAVAYLTNSIYGRCSDLTHCEEVMINNNSNQVTGYAAKTAPTSSSSNAEAQDPTKDGENIVNYSNPLSVKASTTGNYTGIYDMSGGAYEYVMGVMYDNNDKTPSYGSSGFTEETFPKDSKYYDKYSYNSDFYNYTKRILGDATGEMGPFNTELRSSYYGDLSHFVYSGYPWFRRGRDYDTGTGAGMFCSGNLNGSAGSYGFRLVLAM